MSDTEYHPTRLVNLAETVQHPNEVVIHEEEDCIDERLARRLIIYMSLVIAEREIRKSGPWPLHVRVAIVERLRELIKEYRKPEEPDPWEAETW